MNGTGTILDAMAHPQVFGPHFRGDTWQPWRAFLAALFGLPMDDAAVALYRDHTGRQTPPAAPFTEAELVIGRRGGKSRVLALIAVYLAAFRNYEPLLAAGEVATIAVIAADRKQARSIFRYAIGLLRAVPALSAMIADELAESIALSNRVVIEITTASFRNTRGYTYAAVLCDEVAYWRDESGANPDTEILRAIRPGMSSIPGSVLLIASSPYRRAGALWTTFKRHYGRDDARVLVWKATTLEMNPSLDRRIVEEAYEEDAVAAAAEYGAEFRDDIAEFVSRAVVDACTIDGRFELLPVSGTRYVGFVDPSGGSADSMTLAIAHRDKDSTMILDAVREVKPPFSPEAVVAEFAAVLKAYRLSAVTGDRYAGEWVREPFRAHGIKYDLSEKTKVEIYRDTLPLLNSGKLELLDIPRLAAQLAGLERRTARGGRDSIDHPPGGHDDVANAACGALLLANTKRPAMVITEEMLAMSRQPGSRALWGRG